MRIVAPDDFTNTFGAPGPLERLRRLGEVTCFDRPVPDEEEAIRRLQGAEIVVANRERTPLSRRVLEACPDLKLLSMTGSRFNSLDLAAATELGIVVAGTASTSSRGVAELTFGLMIALLRRIPRADAAVRAGEWPSLVGPDLGGKTLGIVGMGRIGTSVASIAPAFRMPALAWGPTLTPERAEAAGARYVTLDELLATADVVTLHVRLTSLTRGLLGAREIGLMKSTAVLINTARAAIVDEEALVAALRERRIAGAALDVFPQEPPPANHPLFALDNVVLTPHIGWTTTTTQEQLGAAAVENVEAYLSGRKPRVLNPEVWERRRR